MKARFYFALLAAVTLAACGSDEGDSADPEGLGGAAASGGSAASSGGGSGGAAGGASGAPSGDPFFEAIAGLSAPRQEHAVVALDGEIYVIGGFRAADGLTSSVEVYDPANDAWREVAPFPVALHHANAAVAGGQLFVLGFMTDFAFSETGEAYAYDPQTDAWRERTAMPAGTERASAAVATVGDLIYVMGGAANGTVAAASVYDAATDSWRDLPPMPAPREHGSAAAIDGIVYVAGGRSDGIVTHTDVVLAFDPQTERWSTRAPMPTSRGGVAGAELGGLFHVFGGEGNPNAASGVFDSAEAYDPVADAWKILPPMAVPRHGFGAASIGDRIYLPGGATTQAAGAVADSSVFGYR